MRVAAICAVLVTATLWGAAVAQEPTTAVVGIGSTKVLTVGPAEGIPATKRAKTLHSRLIDILSVIRAGQDPEVRVQLEPTGPAIFVKGIRFVTVTQADAQLHKCTPLALSRVWTAHLDKVLRAAAPLNTPDDFAIPAAARVEVTVALDPTFVSPITGERRFTVTLKAGGGQGSLPVQVMKRDDTGATTVARIILGRRETTRLTVVTRGPAVLEALSQGKVLYHEQFAVPQAIHTGE